MPADFLSWLVYLILGHAMFLIGKRMILMVVGNSFLKSLINIATFRCDCQVVLVLNMINYEVKKKIRGASESK